DKVRTTLLGLNEETVIKATLQNLILHTQNTSHEIIVSDGGSRDGTVKLAKNFAHIVKSDKGRASQLNKGAKKATGDILFFVQADAIIPEGALEAIESKIYTEGYDGGGFSNIFSRYNKKIKTLGRILNFRIITNDHRKNLIFFGDNGIFCKREIFDRLDGFKLIPIMEDYDFSKRLSKRFRAVRILDPKLVISPRRFIKNGFIRTRLQWIIIKRLYQIGISPHYLVKLYKDVR
ncbi:MAG: glycosyltransferase family 2 protein, partial [Actinomycetia bacterium]|nr:glycosyltransferase family 2 protein [Actinomycetes bacterium]